MQSVINSPAVHSFYREVAKNLLQYIPRHYDSVLVVAASSGIAQELAGDSPASQAHYKQAIVTYLNKLPDNLEIATGIIAQDGGKALGIPGLKEDHDKLAAARQALADAEAEIAQIEFEKTHRMERVHTLDRVIQDNMLALSVWDRDWDGIESAAKEIIASGYATPIERSCPRDRSLVECAFVDLQRAPILRELAPGAVAKINATIESAKAELLILRPAVAEKAPDTPLVRGVIKSRPQLATLTS